MRLPGLSDVKRGEPVVFNYPQDDEANNGTYDYPVDKKMHYIKRCVGVSGDSLEVRNKQVFINGIASKNPEKIQYKYVVKMKVPFTVKGAIRMDMYDYMPKDINNMEYYFFMDKVFFIQAVTKRHQM